MVKLNVVQCIYVDIYLRYKDSIIQWIDRIDRILVSECL